MKIEAYVEIEIPDDTPEEDMEFEVEQAFFGSDVRVISWSK